MASRTKRTSYDTETDSSSDESMGYYPPYKQRNLKIQDENFLGDSKVKVEDSLKREMRKMKCSTRNAVMARENRQRKKLYIQNLEDEVSKLRNEKGKLNSILDNQSFVISELRKEVKYMKSVLVNSADIGNLIKNIRYNTGMSVTTSLDKSLTMNNDCVSKRAPIIAKKTAHPWGEVTLNTHNSSPDSELTLPSVSDISEDYNALLNDLDLPFDFENPLAGYHFDTEDPLKAIETVDDKNYQTSSLLNEHNYTSSFVSKDTHDEDDVGVCLHVSKHRVSLEFCPACSENAHQTWNNVE